MNLFHGSIADGLVTTEAKDWEEMREVEDLLATSSIGTPGACSLADSVRPSSVRAVMTRAALPTVSQPQLSPLVSEPIDRADAERLAVVLKALADPARLRLLSLIQSAPDGEACVSDLTAPLGLSSPTVGHHLRILVEAGLLEREKRGVWAFYRLVPSAIGTIADLLTPPRKRATKMAPRRGLA